ncbi:MAG: GTP-binding protein, partial [bacterium]|nr:GTP-binding protein [bacterium]
TSLLKRLTKKKFDPEEPSTHGINIRDLGTTVDDKQIKMHLWDFGGQEIMHASHQFFLSKRSLYILVLDGRKDEKIEYWLKHIESFGGNSPILVVLNKADEQHAFDVNRKFLKAKYNSIQNFFRVSCKTGRGIPDFANGLRKSLSLVEHLKTTWPRTWFNVKDYLEERTEDYITYEQFKKICRGKNIADTKNQATLIEFLNDLGVVLHLKDFHLQHIGVLNPRWVTEGVYAIITAEKLTQCKGILDLNLLAEILDPGVYPSDKYTFIIDLMKKFELCYSLDDKRVLIPDLLGKEEPAFDFDMENSLKFLVEYDFLPKSVMPRFMVKMHEDIDNKLRWRTGVVLKSSAFKSRALVRVDEEAKKVAIYVNGEQKRDYFAVIRNALRAINESFEKLDATEKVPLPDKEGISIEYPELIGYQMANRDDIFVGKLGKSYSTGQLLADIGINTPEKIKQEMEWLSRKMEFHFHINPHMEANPKITQIHKDTHETNVKTDVKVDIDIDINLSVEFPDFQDDFQELRKLLAQSKPEDKETLKEIGDSLDSLSAETVKGDKGKLNAPMNKLRRFLNNLKDEDSDLHKVLSATKKGIET